MSDTDELTYDQGYYQGYKFAVFANLPAGIVYGAYIVVYIGSVYVILSKPGFTSSPHRMSLLGITTLMFALGIITLALNTMLGILGASNQVSNDLGNDNSVPLALTACYIISDATSSLMPIICDSICAWRTVIIWNKDKRVIAIFVFCIFVSTVTAGFGLYIEISSIIFGVQILVTNMLSTGLIAWKAWQRRIPVMDHLREGSGSLKFERVFALLIESGFIYCCIWLLNVISIAVIGIGYIINIEFVSGIYPTLIIILVSKQMSPIEHYYTHSTDSTELLFTGVPTPGPLADGSML